MKLRITQALLLLPVFLIISFTGCSENRRIPGIGDSAPGFTLKNQVQMNVTLSNFKGKKNVILVFYALDFTPV